MGGGQGTGGEFGKSLEPQLPQGLKGSQDVVGPEQIMPYGVDSCTFPAVKL